MRQQRGFALLTAVMIGAVLVVIVAAGMAYVIGSGRFLSAGQSRDVADNAAQAGIAWAIANFDSGDPAAVATSDVAYGSANYSISVADDSGQGYVLTASGWQGSSSSSAQVHTLRTIIQPTDLLADYAIAANGNVEIDNHASIWSAPTAGLGNVRSNSNATVDTQSSTDGVVDAEGTATIGTQSSAAGSSSGMSAMTFPVYSVAQLLQFQAAAEASQSVQIPQNSLSSSQSGTEPSGCGDPNTSRPSGCGTALEGYYYSYPGYDVTTAQTNGLTLEISQGNYTLDGTMFVAGSVLIDNHVNIVGQGRIIATEGITADNHVAIAGATNASKIDLVCVYGNITIDNHATLGPLGDVDSNSSQFAWLPSTAMLSLEADRFFGWLNGPAYADTLGARKSAPSGFVADGDGADQEHDDDWQNGFSSSTPVGSTVWAQQGNVEIDNHCGLIGSIVAGGTVTFENHCDLVRNSADPGLSVGIESWKASSYQTVK